MEQDRWIQEPDKKGKSNHFKFIAIVGLIAAGLIAFALLNREPKVDTLTLDKTNASMGIDQTDRLTATVKPDEAQPILIWESSDENVVTVTDGVVLARNAGKAIVKVSVKDQQDISATCEYVVLEPEVDIETLDILEEPIILRPGGHQQLTVSYTPENQNEKILWSSTDESIARVNPRGKVEAIKVGMAHIIATSERTGIADTAAVSVEGAGLNDKVVIQVNHPQTAQAQAPKPATAPAAKPATAPATKPATVAAKPETAQKTVQTAAPKPVPSKTTKPVQATAPAKTTKPVQTTTPQTTTASKTTTAPKATTTSKSSGSKDFGYATYKGNWPNDVRGRMEFKSSHIIDSKDPKARVAQPGDYVVGEWSEGHLVQGIWYGADNKAKGSILIGK